MNNQGGREVRCPKCETAYWLYSGERASFEYLGTIFEGVLITDEQEHTLFIPCNQPYPELLLRGVPVKLSEYV